MVSMVTLYRSDIYNRMIPTTFGCVCHARHTTAAYHTHAAYALTSRVEMHLTARLQQQFND
jgi:hypothetical protein